MNAKVSKFFNYAWRVVVIFISIVFFPLGLFMLGYIIGSRKREPKFVESAKNESKLVEKLISESENDSDEKVVL